MAKRALLIGINKYLIPGADPRGCVNDVADMSALLTEFGGFKKSDITVLIDQAATKKAMMSAIKALVKSSKKGDVAFLHYSGHGFKRPDDDENRDEADGRDEILCPSDLNWDDTLRDWLRTTFDTLPAGVNLTVVMDCCHSGSNTRAIQLPDAPVKERYLPSPWGIAAAETGRSLPKKVNSTVRRSKGAQRRLEDVVNADIPELLITGCRDTQTSADAFINGRYNGALTFGLAEAIRQAKGKLTPYRIPLPAFVPVRFVQADRGMACRQIAPERLGTISNHEEQRRVVIGTPPGMFQFTEAEIGQVGRLYDGPGQDQDFLKLRAQHLHREPVGIGEVDRKTLDACQARQVGRVDRALRARC